MSGARRLESLYTVGTDPMRTCGRRQGIWIVESANERVWSFGYSPLVGSPPSRRARLSVRFGARYGPHWNDQAKGALRTAMPSGHERAPCGWNTSALRTSKDSGGRIRAIWHWMLGLRKQFRKVVRTSGFGDHSFAPLRNCNQACTVGRECELNEIFNQVFWDLYKD